MAKYLDYEGLKHYNEKLSTTTLAKKLDKTGGMISGDLTVQKKLRCETAPTENNDVLRYQDTAVEVETSLMGA